MFFILCAAEVGIFVAVLALYRVAGKPDVWSFLSSLPGIAFLCSSVVVMVCLAWTFRALCINDRQARRRALVGAIINLVTLPLFVGSLETASRLLSRSAGPTERIFGVVLYPKHWLDVVSSTRAVINEMTTRPSYLVHDPILGWTVAPSRRDATGRNMSSEEGLRSPRSGISFRDPRTRHSGISTHPFTVRVALLGDSMTFGEEVRCEESWGHLLETLLQPDTQVLNFGVSAHGLNQTFLRYEKDVRSWKPHIVVIGVSSAMVLRINSVYPFIMNPEWIGFPFVRPRLIEKNARPVAVNSPVPNTIDVSVHSIENLPYLELDDYFRPLQWERQGFWRPLEQSYFFRLVNSLRPPPQYGQRDISLESIRDSQFVIRSMVQKVREGGAVPLIVTLPYESELEARDDHRPTVRMLSGAGLPYHDMAGCLRDEEGSEKFIASGPHYSAQSNVHIADCLQPILASEIGRLKSAPSSMAVGQPQKIEYMAGAMTLPSRKNASVASIKMAKISGASQ
ncbi:hypothetical protein W02_11140 [Nitrospira sp. KM1]|uniref:SGNH/GDSL hydrolase family protein n=1 Tax=Nitrospira sp. KM1 TaxID=1936990 RepID=UPI0013A7B0F4|nr:hypothetical protein [Nitrospira sp. KM1]BCA53974.1 hypothetical protein W02_11140 [Nitrospira sp. KM1]